MVEMNYGDYVLLKTPEKEWKGVLLKSYDKDVFLIKLDSGYNIGILKDAVLKKKVIEKVKKGKKRKFEFKKKEGLRNVALIVTGGTISSKLDVETGGVKPTDVGEILKIAPGIEDVCNIVAFESPFVKLSENVDYRDWKALAKSCKRYLDDENVDGIIIAHGTDTLHYTSAALSFFIRNINKPIALTYAQRSIDRASSDANLNLICAARFATSDAAEIAIVGHENLDDEYCLAMPSTRTRKMHTSRRDAFVVINSQPIARIDRNNVEFLRDFRVKDKKEIVKIDDKFNEKVALVKVYPGQDPRILDYYLKEGYKGIVLEVTGMGHVPGRGAVHNWVPHLKRIIAKGVVVCAAAQTLYGRLNPNVYASGRELMKTGMIFLEDMLPETAFVKLGWVLGHKNWKKDVKAKMLKSFVGEVDYTNTYKS